MLERPNVCYIFEEQGFQGFKYDMNMDMADMNVVDNVMYFISSNASSYIPSGIEWWQVMVIFHTKWYNPEEKNILLLQKITTTQVY